MTKTVTVFFQIRENYRRYFTMNSADYTIFENVKESNFIEKPNGSLGVIMEDGELNMHRDAWVTWSIEY